MKVEKLIDKKDSLYEYTKFVNEIRNGRKLTQFSELGQYRHNLKLLFNCSCFKNKEVVRQDEVDMAVTLVKELGDIKLNKKIIDTLEESLYSRFTYLINGLAFLYKPQIIIDDFDLYIKISNKIFLDSIYSWYFTTIDTGNDELNQIYEYMKTICTVQEAIYSSFIRSKFVQFIFGCIHYYNTFSSDYVSDLVKDEDYYLNKLMVSGCSLFNKDGNYDLEKAKFIFENFNDIFTKEQIYIR